MKSKFEQGLYLNQSRTLTSSWLNVLDEFLISLFYVFYFPSKLNLNSFQQSFWIVLDF